MKGNVKMLQLLIRICSFNFGEFEREEFKKFLRMGLIFALIIGVYWTLRPLKDSLFIQLVDKMHLPYAKTISVLALLPLVIFYTKLLERTSREKMLLILPSFYGLSVLCFGVLMLAAQGTPEEIAARSLIPFMATKILGYVWYLFVESFGSLVVALFWAFATDTTEPTSAKRGFPLVVAIGQMGGIICPYGIGGLPHRLELKTDMLSMMVLGLLILSIIPLVRYFLRVTPSHLLTAFHGKNEKEEEAQQEPGFLEGLKLMLSHKYLIGIFAVNFIYEFVVTIFDFNFKLAAAMHYSGVALSNYLSIYGSSVNIVSLLCLLLGISNITRFLGVGVALMAMPVIVGLALFSFLTIDSLSFLFTLMVGSKAINYALNGPALKQLYIPTTTDVRFKAQAWIETFGSRSSKEAGSVFNMLLKPLQNVFGEIVGKAHYLTLSGVIGFPLLALWFVTAFYLGKKFRCAISEKRVVC
ncbi:Npt1/Npt2 family nucleotide transporter [Geitlerinema splendidum]|nr:Npt1/Npt2 family nucleotide transporter [Geitlerinema splendidum]